MTDCRTRTTCRLCGGAITKALELTPTPPANELVTKAFVESGAKQDVFPLELMTCGECGHVQISAVVSPERLFANYPYRSGASPVFREHLRRYADDFVDGPEFVVEIGSNDGTFLQHVADRGARVLGVDPAASGSLPAFQGRFTRAIAGDIHQTHGPADLIVANHVFATIDDPAAVAI